MKSGIYKITSPIGKIYIGQSIDIEKRFKYYEYNHSKNQVILYRSFNKYGIKNHLFEIVEYCDIDQLNNIERYYQDLYEVCGHNGLNCKLTTSSDKSGRYSDQTKLKMSKSMQGKNTAKRSIEAINKTSEKLRGIPRPQHIIDELKKRTGKNNPMFGRKINESSKELQREKLRGSNNYLYKPLLNMETGIYYDTLQEAADTISIDRRKLWQNIKKAKVNKTKFIYP